MSKFNLSRRTVLRGLLAGGAVTTVGLPMLEAMLNSNGTALAGGNPLPQRFVTYFFGNGFVLPRFVPGTAGPDFPLSEELAPLANVREYCSVITGMNNRCEETITHHEGMTIFNGHTMVNIQGLSSQAGGPTIDQLVADAIEASGNGPTVKSIQLGVSRRLSTMDGGTTMHNLSHRGPSQALPPEFNPQNVWNTLFGNFTVKDDPSGPLRASVLDAVKGQTAALKKRLGSKDNERLDAHLEGIDALQKKIEATPPACTPPGLPSETNPLVNGAEPIIKVNQIMSDLVAYAFACDITRVASMLLVGGAADTVLYDTFGNPQNAKAHHLLTHSFDQNVQNGIVHEGVLYQMARLADFIQTLKNTADPMGGNLLDNTMVFFSSDCSEGWSHSVQKQPMIIVGRGGGYLKPQSIHYSVPGGNPTDVLLGLLRAFNPAAQTIGSGDPMSSTPFADMLA